MNTLALSAFGLGLSLLVSTANANETQLKYLNCQAANTLGTATVGLGTEGEVLIQTTSVVGATDDHYTVANITRTLENNRGSKLHLVNKEEKRAGVLLVFHRPMPEELSRLDGYLYSVAPAFDAAKDKAPAVPVAFVTCTVSFK